MINLNDCQWVSHEIHNINLQIYIQASRDTIAIASTMMKTAEAGARAPITTQI